MSDLEANPTALTAVEPETPISESATSDSESVEIAPTSTEAAAEVAPTFVVVYVASVLFELPAPHPVLTLREEEWPYRTLQFPVGLPEAQSVALAIEETRAARPSTHELFSDALAATKNDIIAARIVRETRGIFYAELDMMNPRGRTVLDCRPTDAIILALRQKVPAPILIDATLLTD
jgi:bifunctional DNase/RNase